MVSGAEPSRNAALGLNADPKKLSELYEASAYFTPPTVHPDGAGKATATAPLAGEAAGNKGRKRGAVKGGAPYPTSTANQVGTLLRRMWIAQRCVGLVMYG